MLFDFSLPMYLLCCSVLASLSALLLAAAADGAKKKNDLSDSRASKLAQCGDEEYSEEGLYNNIKCSLAAHWQNFTSQTDLI